MPKIDIKERDLTTAGGLNGSSNVVYVPGFVKHINSKYASKIKFPYLFNSVSEFKTIFSEEDGDFNLLGYSDVANNFERSQLYALSILQTGLPVLFDLVGGVGVETNSTAAEY